MEDYSKWNTEELLNYLFELGETKCNCTWISPVGEEKLKELEVVKEKVIAEVMLRTITP